MSGTAIIEELNRLFYSVPQPSTLIEKWENAKTITDSCASERPARKVICQRSKGHKGPCRAVVFWEEE